MKKMVAVATIMVLVLVLAVPMSALAVGPQEPARTQSAYSGDVEEPPGSGDTDCLRTRDRLYEQDCVADCDQTGTKTQTQTQMQTQAQTQAQTQMQGEPMEPLGAQVKAQVKAGPFGDGETPDETPVASTVHAETQAGEGFFGDIAAGLQRIALRLMAWLGLL